MKIKIVSSNSCTHDLYFVSVEEIGLELSDAYGEVFLSYRLDCSLISGIIYSSGLLISPFLDY